MKQPWQRCEHSEPWTDWKGEKNYTPKESHDQKPSNSNLFGRHCWCVIWCAVGSVGASTKKTRHMINRLCSVYAPIARNLSLAPSHLHYYFRTELACENQKQNKNLTQVRRRQNGETILYHMVSGMQQYHNDNGWRVERAGTFHFTSHCTIEHVRGACNSFHYLIEAQVWTHTIIPICEWCLLVAHIVPLSLSLSCTEHTRSCHCFVPCAMNRKRRKKWANAKNLVFWETKQKKKRCEETTILIWSVTKNIWTKYAKCSTDCCNYAI